MPVEPEVVKPDKVEKAVRLTREGKPFREQRRGKIAELPEAVRSELDARLTTDSFRNYRWLSQWLEEKHAARISPSALNYRKKHQLDLELLPVKFATQEARDIVAATGGDSEEINRALTMVVQTKLFEMLINLDTMLEAFEQFESAREHSKNVRVARARKKAGTQPGADKEGTPPPESAVAEFRFPLKMGLAAISALVKNTTAIGAHVRDTERWEIERDTLLSKIDEATHKVTKVASEAGLSPELEKTIRDALMEIRP
jgi:hypothetical protein